MTGGILLAAGSSSRMGQSKQMLDIHGEKLLRKTAKTILETDVNNIVVVLGAHEHEHRQILRDLKADIVFNESWQRGMGSSIKTGLKYLKSKHEALDAVLICVCDQPMLSTIIISDIVHKYQENKKPIIAAGYAGVPGVPVLFDQSFF